jgi:HEAT repeat protein
MNLGHLLDEISGARGEMPEAAIEDLLALGEPAVEQLLGLLDSVEPDEDDWTPYWTVVALGELRSPRAVPALLQLLRLPEGGVLAEAAAEALIKTGPPAAAVLPVFIRNTPEWEARQLAYHALGNIPSDASLAVLVEALDRDALLWSSIAAALADLGDRRAVPALRSALAKCDEREASAFREAIDILEGRHPPHPKPHLTDWRERYRRLALERGEA